MKQNKQMYLSPETEVLVVRFEGALCGSPYNTANHTQYITGGNDDDYEEL